VSNYQEPQIAITNFLYVFKVHAASVFEGISAISQFDHVQIAAQQPIFQDTAIGDIDSLTFVGDDDDGAAEGDVAPKVDVAGHCQVVQLDDLGDLLETLLELLNLLEVITQLDNGRSLEHPSLVDDELAVRERVDITLDQEEIRAALDWEETFARNINPMGVLEMLDGCTSRSFKLDHRLSVVRHLGVDDNLQLHAVSLHDALQRLEVDPQVVSVEDLEFADRLEVLDVLRRDLGNLEQAHRAIVVNESSSLDVGLGLVRDFHQKLGLGVNHVLKDALVDNCSQVVGVGHKQVLLALSQKLVEHTRVQEGVVQVTVTRGVPVLLVVIGLLWAGEEGLLVDPGIPRLVESRDAELLVGILLDNAESIFVGVERGHKNQRHIDAASGVEVLDLADSEIQEGHVILDLERALCAGHTHRGTETTIDLEDRELVEILGVRGLGQLSIRDNLFLRWRLDEVPVKVLALGALGEVAGEEVEEGLHLGVERLLGLLVADGSYEMADLVAHRLGRDTSRRRTEIDMAGASDSCVERVVSR